MRTGQDSPLVGAHRARGRAGQPLTRGPPAATGTGSGRRRTRHRTDVECGSGALACQVGLNHPRRRRVRRREPPRRPLVRHDDWLCPAPLVADVDGDSSNGSTRGDAGDHVRSDLYPLRRREVRDAVRERHRQAILPTASHPHQTRRCVWPAQAGAQESGRIAARCGAPAGRQAWPRSGIRYSGCPESRLLG
jgi:hypothetical protein